MKYGLGIDTGGTYTDAVIFDFETKAIISSAKSVTIKEDLTLGINNALQQLPVDKLSEVMLVSLSTTLATNACVEGKGSRAVLILIGCDRDIVEEYGVKYGLPDSDRIIFLDGGHDQEGHVKNEPDWNYLKRRISEFEKTADAFAVVELWGIRNIDYERKSKDFISEWTGKPVVCGHDLTDEVNSLKRAASALLNAQLIPLVNDFINSVKSSLSYFKINAPLVIVRGDGSLMSEEFAREKPVETLLSGPAASVSGGINLSKRKNCVVVDMGGTTTDLALVRDGIPILAYEGVKVGDWRTGTKSIYINTFGLGGDSLIRHNKENKLLVGPFRAAPLSWLADKCPEIIKTIKELKLQKKRHTVSLCEFFYLIKDITNDSYYNDEEKEVVKMLKDSPKSILELSESTGISIYGNRFQRLEKHGIIMRSGLTPTDIMHLTGDFSGWNRDAAQLGAEIMAFQLNITLDELNKRVYHLVKRKLYYNIVKMLLENENEELFKGIDIDSFHDLIMMGYRKPYYEGIPDKSSKNKGYIESVFNTGLSLIGIGAPIHIYLPDVAKSLNAECIISEKASVANAVGAITGNITVEEKVIIRPNYQAGTKEVFMCYSSVSRAKFEDYHDAISWAESEATKLARENAIARGAGEVNVVTSIDRNEAALSGYFIDADIENQFPEEMKANDYEINDMPGSDTFLIEVTITARAIGSLKWL
ncbi:MAG: hydantoinase/oxoprolinase family protein [Acetivibrionales bacterium]|jgi:N-methylhydantoinase A/oxoprolinase/acetone carboxylase beta subunit